MKAEKRMLAQLKKIERLDKLSSDLLDTDESASDKAYADMWKLVEEVASLAPAARKLQRTGFTGHDKTAQCGEIFFQ